VTRSRRCRAWFPPVAVVVLVAGLYLPMLLTGTRLSDNDDFLQYASRQEHLRRCVFQFGSFPSRSHYLGGGFPTLGDPEDSALNPLAWLLLPLATPLALKVKVFVVVCVGAAGAWVFARWSLGCGPWGASLVSLLSCLSIWVPQRVESGNPNELYPVLVPLCLHLLLTAARRPLRLAWLVILFCIMLSDGKHTFLAGLLYMGILCGLWIISGPPPGRRAARVPWKTRLLPPAWLAIAIAFTLAVGMARILPAARLLGAHGGLAGLRLVTHVGATVYATPAELLRGLAGLKGGEFTWRWSFVGLPALALFVAGLVRAPRRVWPWLATIVIFFWLTVGPHAGVDLLGLLRRVPLFGVFDRPAKYCAPFIALSVAMGAGVFLDAVARIRRRKLALVLAASALLSATLVLAPNVIAFSSGPFCVVAPAAATPEAFHQVRGLGLLRNRSHPANAIAYYNMRRDVGTVDWYTAVPLAEYAKPRFFVTRDGRERPNPAYRGEAYLLHGGGTIRSVAIGPTRVDLEIAASAPDVVVINQNAHSGWRLRSNSRALLTTHEGLLAVDLPEEGEYHLRLAYVSAPFRIGLCLSVAGAAMLGLFLLFLRRGRWRCLTITSDAETISVEGIAEGKGSLPVWAAAVVVLAAVLLSTPGRWLICRRHFDTALRGESLLREGRLEEAEDLARGVLAEDPDHARAHVVLAIVLSENNRLDDALRLARRAVRLRERDEWAWHVLGSLLERRGDLEAAAECYRKAIHINPRWWDAWLRLGALRERDSDREGAHRCYEAAVKAKPSEWRVHRRLAGFLVRRGRPQEALPHFQRAWELDQTQPGAAYLLARTHVRLRRYADAVAVLQRPETMVVSGNDDNLLLAWLLATVPEETLREGPRALSIIQGILAEKDRKTPAQLDVLGAAYAEVGRFDEAAAAARDALRRIEEGERASSIRKRLAAYEKGMPWRLAP